MIAGDRLLNRRHISLLITCDCVLRQIGSHQRLESRKLMQRHLLALWSLAAILILASCGGTAAETTDPTAGPTSGPNQLSSATPLATSAAAPAPAATAWPTATAATRMPIGAGAATIELREITRGVKQPVFVTHAGDG